jgi:hypothetical protein
MCRCVNVASGCAYFPEQKQNFYNICPATGGWKANDEVKTIDASPSADPSSLSDSSDVHTGQQNQKRQAPELVLVRSTQEPGIRYTMICDGVYPSTDSGRYWTEYCSKVQQYSCDMLGKLQYKGPKYETCSYSCRCVNMESCVELFNDIRVVQLCPLGKQTEAIGTDSASANDTDDPADSRDAGTVSPSGRSTAELHPRDDRYVDDILEGRHYIAMICDLGDLKSDTVRNRTKTCAGGPWNYVCSATGKLSSSTKKDGCNNDCRCVDTAKLNGPPESAAPDPQPALNDRQEAGDLEYYGNPLELRSLERLPESAAETVGGRLQKRHDWVLVCDRYDSDASHQKLRTLTCMDWTYKYYCTADGHMTQKKGGWRNEYCDSICRCVNLRPKPKCILSPGSKSNFYDYTYCGPKNAKTDINAATDPVTPAKRDIVEERVRQHRANLERESTPLGSRDLAKQDDKEPALGYWHPACTDNDSIFDPEWRKECQDKRKCRCDDNGELSCDEKKDPKFECYASCICIQDTIADIWKDVLGLLSLKDEGDIPGHPPRPSLLPASITAISQMAAITANPRPRAMAEDQDIQPVMSPWNMWCTDDDSINDQRYNEHCSNDKGCHCNITGNVICDKDAKEHGCVAGCVCIKNQLQDLFDLTQAPTDPAPPHVPASVTSIAQVTAEARAVVEEKDVASNQACSYAISCGPYDSVLYDSGSGAHPLGDKCRHDQTCTATGAMTTKQGASAASQAVCSKYCSCQKPVGCAESSSFVAREAEAQTISCGAYESALYDSGTGAHPLGVQCRNDQTCSADGVLITKQGANTASQAVCRKYCACKSATEDQSSSFAAREIEAQTISCGAYESTLYDSGTGAHPLGAQCRNDQTCSADGVLVAKSGASSASLSVCRKYCACKSAKDDEQSSIATRDTDTTTSAQACYAISCGPYESTLYDSGSGAHPLGAQCRNDQTCSAGGVMVLKAGASSASQPVCNKYCACNSAPCLGTAGSTEADITKDFDNEAVSPRDVEVCQPYRPFCRNQEMTGVDVGNGVHALGDQCRNDWTCTESAVMVLKKGASSASRAVCAKYCFCPLPGQC